MKKSYLNKFILENGRNFQVRLSLTGVYFKRSYDRTIEIKRKKKFFKDSANINIITEESFSLYIQFIHQNKLYMFYLGIIISEA